MYLTLKKTVKNISLQIMLFYHKNISFEYTTYSSHPQQHIFIIFWHTQTDRIE